jgi:ABC-type nitrate/sulfonate/bicarbonate transport system substrate-binding protein
MLKVFLLTVIVLTANLLCPDAPVAQERARVGWAAITASHTPLWVAQEKGFVAKQGLLIEPIFFGAGPPAMQALVAGDLDIVVTSAPNVVNPRLGGADTVMVLSIIPTFIDHIISAPSITASRALSSCEERSARSIGLAVFRKWGFVSRSDGWGSIRRKT